MLTMSTKSPVDDYHYHFAHILTICATIGSERANLNSLRTLDELRVFLNRFYSTTSIETITSLAMEACTSTLSDHKPIKALLELETKLWVERIIFEFNLNNIFTRKPNSVHLRSYY